VLFVSFFLSQSFLPALSFSMVFVFSFASHFDFLLMLLYLKLNHQIVFIIFNAYLLFFK
jgi:hypothetical protein